MLRTFRADYADLETEVAQQAARSSFSMARAFFLQQLARRQHRSALLTAHRLYVHGAAQVEAHHLGDAARIVAIAVIRLRLEERLVRRVSVQIAGKQVLARTDGDQLRISILSKPLARISR
ncbi:hypothetical protein X737_27410 [Mesorhizobium sp. L48C026A00]|nr:hypothetical protein X737_27410 [Mesorhizobium sp. L48C026A00]